MKIGLLDSDKTKFPNLALMKISAHHKLNGDEVEFYNEDADYDKIYLSKVFTYTDMPEIKNDCDIIIGGSGTGFSNVLPDEIEHIMPDYGLYVDKNGEKIDYSMGFLTRGCINKCEWCLVPKKEGYIRKNADIAEFLKHKNVVLMDNNILACSHGIEQLEKISTMGIKIDCNQGLDARLIDNSIAKLLSKIKWFKPIRLACDSQPQMKYIQKAVANLRWHNATPRRYFVYCLIKDVEESIERIKFLKGLDLDVFAQPYRDFKNNVEPTQKQKDLARYVNHKAIFKKIPFEEYKND